MHFGRRSSQIKLKPLSFVEFAESTDDTFENKVKRYAVTGGVPRYIEFFEDKRDIKEQVADHVFSNKGFLYDEPLFLLKDEIESPEKTRKGLYSISDHFTRFWFQYVYPYKGELETENTRIVTENFDKHFASSFVANSYEEICKQIFIDMCLHDKIDFSVSKIGKYWNKHMEIDFVALDNHAEKVCFGECKYHEREVDAESA